MIPAYYVVSMIPAYERSQEKQSDSPNVGVEVEHFARNRKTLVGGVLV